MRSLFPNGFIAAIEDAEFPISDLISLEPGDLVFFLTDGVLEARFADGEFFGTERTLQIVSDSRNKTAKEIIETLYQAVLDFSGREKQEDDVTVVVIKVLG